MKEFEKGKCSMMRKKTEEWETDRQRRKPNKWGEADRRSNPSDAQTALKGATALRRRRDQARRTS